MDGKSVLGGLLAGVVLAASVSALHQVRTVREVRGLLGQVRTEERSGVSAETVSAMGAAPPPCVMFANIDGALPVNVFDEVVGALRRDLRFRICQSSLPSIDVREFAADRDTVKRMFGGRACLAVFLVDDPVGASYLSQPGSWARIHVGALRKDAPTDERYRQRVVKMLLKGLGLASGVGGNPDPRCVMYHKSFTLAGIDATSASYGPYAMFPIQDTLKMIAGDGIFMSRH